MANVLSEDAHPCPVVLHGTDKFPQPIKLLRRLQQCLKLTVLATDSGNVRFKHANFGDEEFIVCLLNDS